MLLQLWEGPSAFLDWKEDNGSDGIIEPFSSWDIFNEKVCVCVHLCCYSWWHRCEQAGLPLSPPHVTATTLLQGSGELTAATAVSVVWSWWKKKKWKWRCASCDAVTLIGRAAVELMWHIWEDGAEGGRELREVAKRREGAVFDLPFNKPFPSLSPCADCYPPAPGWLSRI